MKSLLLIMLIACCAVVSVFRSPAAENPLIGEWFPLENADSGMGGTRHFKTNGTVIVTFGSALHFKFQLETNGVTNTVLMPGPKGPEGPPVRMDFTITNDTLTLTERKGRQRETLTRVQGTTGEGLFGHWSGKHYTGGQQIKDFTTNLYIYFSVPAITTTGSFTLNGNQLTEEYQGKRVTSEWKIADGVLTITSDLPQKYRRKGAVFAWDEAAFSDKPDPETEKIEALFKHLETLKDATFVRNDRPMEMKEAAPMMRRKWEAQEADIRSATEFIEEIMTASSSGAKKPYLIRFKDGKETKCADYLKAELKKLQATAKARGEITKDPSRLPDGLRIIARSRTHLHADISEVSLEDYPALTNLHALYAVSFEDEGATDEKLEALTHLQFTNLATVSFNDCRLVTDKGIDYLSRISSVTNLWLRDMPFNDATFRTIAEKFRLHDVSITYCTNVTVKGLLAIAQSKTIYSLQFSLADLKQEDLMQLITKSAPQLTRMDIDMNDAGERRLDLPALRQAAKARKLNVYASRNGRGGEL